MNIDEGTLSIEITLPDGTIVWWEREVREDGEDAITPDTVDSVTNAIEAILGGADGMRA